MPSSVLEEKKTASLCPQRGQTTSLVRGSVGSAATSLSTTVFSLVVWWISFLYTHQPPLSWSLGSASSCTGQQRQIKEAWLALEAPADHRASLRGRSFCRSTPVLCAACPPSGTGCHCCLGRSAAWVPSGDLQIQHRLWRVADWSLGGHLLLQ